MAERMKMLYPNAPRVSVPDFAAFFVNVIRPSLPEPRAMRNGSPKTPLRGKITLEQRPLIASNVFHTMLLGIR
jgi:hypothetical protein